MLCTFLLRTLVSVYLCPDCPTNMFPNYGDRPSHNVWRFWWAKHIHRIHTKPHPSYYLRNPTLLSAIRSIHSSKIPFSTQCNLWDCAESTNNKIYTAKQLTFRRAICVWYLVWRRQWRLGCTFRWLFVTGSEQWLLDSGGFAAQCYDGTLCCCRLLCRCDLPWLWWWWWFGVCVCVKQWNSDNKSYWQCCCACMYMFYARASAFMPPCSDFALARMALSFHSAVPLCVTIVVLYGIFYVKWLNVCLCALSYVAALMRAANVQRLCSPNGCRALNEPRAYFLSVIRLC